MRIVFLIIVVLHGLIHLLGFVKAMGFKEVKELTLPISIPIGFVWLSAAVLFFFYGIFYAANSKYALFFGIVAVVVSLILAIAFWQDAKFGTIANFLILVVSIVSFSYLNFEKRVHRETNYVLSQSRIIDDIINEKDIKELPESVKNWLRNSGYLGKPTISYGKVMQKAEMQMNPGQKNWMSATAIQYTTIDKPAFIWTVDVVINSLVNLQGRDKFVNGKGEMLIKMLSLINVVNEKGEKLDEGALQRYLGEMVWFPSLALSPYVTWEAINDETAKATMTYNGTTGSGTFYFDTNGDVTKYSALRYKDNEIDSKRYEWVMNISEYKTFEGVKVPAIMTATWKLDQRDWTWLKLEVIDIQYNQNASW